MDDKIIDMLSDWVNIDSINRKVRDVLFDSFYNNSSDIGNVTIQDYLRSSYIDMLIQKGKAPFELRELYELYKSLYNELGEILYTNIMKDVTDKSPREKELKDKVLIIEKYLEMYGVMSLKVDYKEILNNHMKSLENDFPKENVLKRVLKTYNKSNE